MANIFAAFEGPDGALGSADTGQPWTVLRGTVTRKSGRGFATNASPGPFAVVDAGIGGQDATVSCAINGSGTGGQALYFRVVDANNWWRLASRYYSYSYNTGSTTTFTRRVHITTHVERYEDDQPLRQQPTGNSYTWENFGPYTTDGNPPYPTPVGADPAGSGTSGGTRYWIISNNAYRDESYSAADTAVAYAYDLRLEKSVGGTLTLVSNANVSAFSSLKVVANGNTIRGYVSSDLATPKVTVTDTTHATATRHGFGYAESTEFGNGDGVDSFAVTPFNVAPNAPTLGSLSATLDRTSPQRLAWTFSDPDAGDSQSKYDLGFRLVGASAFTIVTGVSTNQFHDFAANTFTVGDHEWQVRTYDAAGVVGPYSASGFFTAAAPPQGPTITAPVNGVTLPSSATVLTWSYPTQQAYRIRRVADTAGAPNTSVVYFDSGVIPSGTARSASVDFPVNGRHEHLQVLVQDASGLFSPYASIRVLVSYTPPAVPRLYVTVNAPGGSLVATFSQPTPSAGQPIVTSADLFITEDGVSQRRAAGLAPNGSWTYHTPVSKKETAFRLVAIAANGTSTSSLPNTAPPSGGGSPNTYTVVYEGTY